jgi:UDP-N-acetylglucosamine 4-epimerase
MQAPRPHYEHVQALLRARPRTWLVTGVAGFIGSHLLHTLLELNQRVVGLDNFSTGHHSNLDEVRSLLSPTQWARFDFIEGDIRDLPDCLRACQGVDHVLHQAALGSPQHSGDDPIACNDVNVSGFLNMLVAARDCRVTSFTYASSNAVYGEHTDLPLPEQHTGRPLSVFGASKLSNEQYAQVFAHQHDLACTGLRYFDVFGPRQDPNGPDAGLIPQWIASLLRGEPVSIPGDGETRRDFCYVANVVQANLLAAMAVEAPAPRATALTAADTAWRADRSTACGHAKSLIYNAGMGEQVRLNTLFVLLRAHLSADGVSLSAQPSHQDHRASGWGHSQPDMRQARQHLGYAPTHSLVQGLMETLRALPGSGSPTTGTNSIQQDAAFGGPAGVPASALAREAPTAPVDQLAPRIGQLLTRQTP